MWFWCLGHPSNQTISDQSTKRARIFLYILIKDNPWYIAARYKLLKEPFCDVLLINIQFRFNPTTQPSLEHFVQNSNHLILCLFYLLLVKCNWLQVEVLTISCPHAIVNSRANELRKHIQLMLEQLPKSTEWTAIRELSFQASKGMDTISLFMPMIMKGNPSLFHASEMV